MRTSLNEIKFIDDYIAGKLETHEHAVADSRLRQDPVFMLGVLLHKKILRLISLYHNEQLKKKLNGLHNTIMADPVNSDYREKVNDLFKSKKR